MVLAATFFSRSHVVRFFSRSILVDATLAILNVANSIFLVRSLGADVTGHYYLLMAFFGFFPAVLNSFDQVLTRFLPASDEEERTQLTAAVFVAKFYGAVGGLFILTGLWSSQLVSGRFEGLSDNDTSLLVPSAALIGFVLPLIISWSGRTISGYKYYGFEIAVNLLLAVFITCWMGLVFFIPALQRIVIVLTGVAGLTLGAAAAKAWRVALLNPNSSSRIVAGLANPVALLNVLLQTRYRQYFGPFFVTSISGYLKDLFPILVVGSLAPSSTVTAFRIVRQIFSYASKFVPNAFEVVRPSLVSLNTDTSGASRFSVRYQAYAVAYLCLVALFSLACVHGLDLILSVWGVVTTPMLHLAALIFALELLVLSATHIEFQIFLLRDSTGYLAWVSLSRQIVTVVAILLAGTYLGVVGVAMGLLAGTLMTWLSFVGYALRQFTRPPTMVLRTAFGLVALCLLILLTSPYLWLFAAPWLA